MKELKAVIQELEKYRAEYVKKHSCEPIVYQIGSEGIGISDLEIDLCSKEGEGFVKVKETHTIEM